MLSDERIRELALIAVKAQNWSPNVDKAIRLAVAETAEACAKVCEERADYYQQKDRFKFPELCDSAPTGAESCADAIRQRFGIEKE